MYAKLNDPTRVARTGKASLTTSRPRVRRRFDIKRTGKKGMSVNFGPCTTIFSPTCAQKKIPKFFYALSPPFVSPTFSLYIFFSTRAFSVSTKTPIHSTRTLIRLILSLNECSYVYIELVSVAD